MLKRLCDWIVKFLFKKESNKDKGYGFQFVEEVPNSPKDKILYFIGEDGYYWQFVMLCPCGCNLLLHMNLMNDYYPYWNYEIHNDKVSISPSINRLVGCKSHFFVRSGNIIWA